MEIEKLQSDYTKIPEQIMNSLVASIENGALEIGKELPSERDLAERLGVSRGSLRECLAILEFMGAIESRGYRKVLVRGSDYINRLRAWVEGMSEVGTQKTVHEFRRIIEGGIAALACEHATEADVMRLEETLKQLEVDPTDYENDVRFHNALALATHNAMLANTVYLINNFISDIRLKFYDKPQYPERTLQSHRAIYEAVRDRDAERARLEMIHHLNIAADFFDKYQ